MKEYFGKTKHFRIKQEGDDDYKWITLKDGDTIPAELEDRFPEEVTLTKEAKKKLEEIKEDLADDGKLNYSNNPKKKRPGRKKK